jgi:NDP-sugar pyrophosphorylase family protein
MRAVILAAGFGTRLWPLTIGRTKPALPLLNRPLISYTIEYLREYGFEDLIINLHHEPSSVIDAVGDGSRYGVTITYSIEEPEILGTAGALDRVKHLLKDDTFVVINGKIVTDININKAIETHRRLGGMATLVLKGNPRHERFTDVEINEDQSIKAFAGYPTPMADYIPLMFTGIHILEPAIFDFIPQGVFSDTVRDVYPKAMAEGKRIMAHIARENWCELSTVERYLSVSLNFLAREGRELICGEGTEIDRTARVRRSVLWRGVKVGAGAQLSECVIGDNVVIPAGMELSRATVVRAGPHVLSERPPKAQPGTIIGDNLVVPFAE